MLFSCLLPLFGLAQGMDKYGIKEKFQKVCVYMYLCVCACLSVLVCVYVSRACVCVCVPVCAGVCVCEQSMCLCVLACNNICVHLFIFIPWWAEPQRHTVVIVCVCNSVPLIS